MKQIIVKFIADEQGQDIIEYALIGSFVSLASYVGAGILGTAYDTWFQDLAGAVGVGSAKAKAVK